MHRRRGAKGRARSAAPDAAPPAAREALVRFSSVDAAANCAILEDAGYVLDEAAGVWWHPRLKRALDKGVAQVLRAEQVKAWIASGLTSER